MTEHEFYARKTFKLPPRIDGQPQRSAVDLSKIDMDLVREYMREHEVSQRIASAFIAFDLEPPTRAQIEAAGITYRMSKVLDATAPTESEQAGEDQ